MSFKLPALYPILDTRFLPAEAAARAQSIDSVTRELVDSGIKILQLRAKGESREQILRAAEAMLHAAPQAMWLILNDHAELVREAGFHGVHLGQGDLPIADARAMLGPEAILGLSTHTPEQLAEGDRSTADYLATGPVFGTASKADAEPVIGLPGVRAARRGTAKPLVAIGGLTLANAAEVWRAGADSVAVIGALHHPDRSPGVIARDFLQLFR